MRPTVIPITGIILILLLAVPARSETPEEWVALGIDAPQPFRVIEVAADAGSR